KGAVVALSAGGSSDAAGFRMELDLSVGADALEVQSSVGSFTLHTATVADPGDFADSGLHTCMTEAGWAFNGTQPVTAARCSGRGIQALDGIDGVIGLELLDLSRNLVTDLTPLGSLPDLHTLSLASNPVTDLTPLGGLTHLRHLSLAQTAATAAALGDVQTALASHLAVLDLTNATAISTDDLPGIRAGFPATTIISPDGTVFP
ncbi:MAG TPA: leucine-rich repeat domain-containing protein, partial [bacterium]